MSTSSLTELRNLAAKFVSPPEIDWWVRELTKSYAWLRNSELYWIIDSKTDISVLAIKRNGGTYQCLNCPTGMAVISGVIATDLDGAPGERLGLSGFAQLLLEWHSDPRGYVATPAFFEKKRPSIEGWLQGNEKDPQVLRALCIEPVRSEAEGGRWSLTFNVINRRGAVERWLVAGVSTPFDIRSIEISTLKLNGTFSFPDEL